MLTDVVDPPTFFTKQEIHEITPHSFIIVMIYHRYLFQYHNPAFAGPSGRAV
jgi:hypothetical protein